MKIIKLCLKIASLYLRTALINENEIFVFFFFNMSQFMLSPLSFPALPYLVSVTNTTPHEGWSAITSTDYPEHSLALFLLYIQNYVRILFTTRWIYVDELSFGLCCISYYQQSHLHGLIEFGSTDYPRKRCWIFCKVLRASIAH